MFVNESSVSQGIRLPGTSVQTLLLASGNLILGTQVFHI